MDTGKNMEYGRRFNPKTTRSPYGAAATSMQQNIGVPSSDDSSNININNPMQVSAVQQTHCSMREQDQYMPIANVIRIMRRILPTHAKISDDAKETIQECVSEYISFITGEANDRCQREQRKTITAEDIIWAMGKLGFDDYVEPLSLFLNRYREMENERSSSSSIREPIHIHKRGASVSDYGTNTMPLLPTNYMPTMPMGGDHHQGIYDPAMHQFGGGTGYYRDPSGAGGSGSGSNIGSSSNNPTMPNYDPYGQFK